MKTVDSNAIRHYARRHYIEPARRRGDAVIRIVAGDVHRALRLTNRVPLVCSALASRAFLEENNLQLEGREGPPSGISTTVVFTYRAKNTPGDRSGTSRSPFYAVRGIAKGVFESLGGGEAFIRGERREFFGPSDAEPSDRR